MTHEAAEYVKALTEWYLAEVRRVAMPKVGGVHTNSDPGSSPPPPPPEPPEPTGGG